MIHKLIKSAFQPLKAKLSRDIAFKVFLCFVIIEIIVLLPSYQRKHQELQTELESVGLATAKPLAQIQTLNLNSEQLQRLNHKIIENTSILGVSIYQDNGKLLTQIGEKPKGYLPDISNQYKIRQWSPDGNVYLFSLHPNELDVDFIIIAQLDASHIGPELTSYVWRIIGLIILIGLIVTLSTMFALAPKVLHPIFQLRNDLVKVGAAIKKNQPKPDVRNRSQQLDELGEVIYTFGNMVDQIYQAIQARDKAEMNLQTLNTQLTEEIDKRKLIEVCLKESNEALQALAISDGLTQVTNRRHFDTVLEQEWYRLAREQQPLALMMLDVDYFKGYNDAYGHQAGDECLIKIAQAASGAINRPADLIARYGGEEFAIVLPNTNLQGAIVIAEKIQARILAKKIIHTASKASDFITVSIGITCQIPNTKNPFTELISDADTALYQAKRQGRNQYCCHTYNPYESLV